MDFKKIKPYIPLSTESEKNILRFCSLFYKKNLI